MVWHIFIAMGTHVLLKFIGKLRTQCVKFYILKLKVQMHRLVSFLQIRTESCESLQCSYIRIPIYQQLVICTLFTNYGSFILNKSKNYVCMDNGVQIITHRWTWQRCRDLLCLTHGVSRWSKKASVIIITNALHIHMCTLYDKQYNAVWDKLTCHSKVGAEREFPYIYIFSV